VAAGRGVAVFDPSAKGDFIRDLLDRLPADAGDRLVIVDPDTEALPALNLLDPAGTPDGSPHQVAAQVVGVMARVWHRWWGHRTADIAHHGLLTLAHLPGATLADLPRLLTDRTWRTPRVARALEQLGTAQSTLADFWQGFDMLPPGTRTAHTAPLSPTPDEEGPAEHCTDHESSTTDRPSSHPAPQRAMDRGLEA